MKIDRIIKNSYTEILPTFNYCFIVMLWKHLVNIMLLVKVHYLKDLLLTILFCLLENTKFTSLLLFMWSQHHLGRLLCYSSCGDHVAKCSPSRWLVSLISSSIAHNIMQTFRVIYVSWNIKCIFYYIITWLTNTL